MAATRHLLTRDGYDQVSIDAIAKEAGVSRPIYRRWPSKAHVVFEAAFGEPGDRMPIGAGDRGRDPRIRPRHSRILGGWYRPPPGILADRAAIGAAHPDPAAAGRTDPRGIHHAGRRGIDAGVLATWRSSTLYELLIRTAFTSRSSTAPTPPT
jgi:AcrR family transcriptional regulator